MAGLLADEDDGDEDCHGGQRTGEYGGPDFPGSFVRGANDVLAHLAVAVDVFEDDDAVVDDHADGEGDSGERDDVQRAAHGDDDEEAGDDADGNGERDGEGRPPVAEKDEHDDDGEAAAEDDVAVDEGDGLVDVDGFVINLHELQGHFARLEDLLVHARDGFFEFGHHLHDVRAGFAPDGKCQYVLALAADQTLRVLVGHFDIGHFAHVDRSAGRVGDDGVEDLVGGLVLSDGAERVVAFPLGDGAGGDVGVLPAEGGLDLREGDAARGEPAGVDAHLDLALEAAVDIRAGDAGNAVEVGLDVVFGEIAQLANLVAVLRSVENEPGDRRADFGVAHLDRRLLDLDRVAGDLAELVIDVLDGLGP